MGWVICNGHFIGSKGRRAGEIEQRSILMLMFDGHNLMTAASSSYEHMMF